ncbi:unnamed protein product [Caenorhabditis auriculariae]|uniref:Uncharacterized protein n=1 Tax=Caenorhabditis auriculariae TaxID=2777116 RepID=A0A8S1HHV7_9PELO|nr:unnamed protein product [Caenorhabditis auriculariae]
MEVIRVLCYRKPLSGVLQLLRVKREPSGGRQLSGHCAKTLICFGAKEREYDGYEEITKIDEPNRRAVWRWANAAEDTRERGPIGQQRRLAADGRNNLFEKSAVINA